MAATKIENFAKKPTRGGIPAKESIAMPITAPTQG